LVQLEYVKLSETKAVGKRMSPVHRLCEVEMSVGLAFSASSSCCLPGQS